jgi:prepilin-type N-terminal cleavage/methylation domain-containing protein/prepilin-type processing-associated H-X9-DG protein
VNGYRRAGFTLLEILVATAIMATLIALLFPAVQAARESARRTQCASHLRQLGLATNAYVGAHNEFPPGVNQFNNSGWGSVAFRGIPLFAYLLPYLEEDARLVNWDYNDPMNNANQGASSNTATVLPLFLCPSDVIRVNPIMYTTGGQNWVYTLGSYGGNGGSRTVVPQAIYPKDWTPDGIFQTTGQASEPKNGQRAIYPAEVTDGLGRTLLFGERRHDDRNYNTFLGQGWGDFSVDQWGWWGASTSRKMIMHVVLSANAPINYQLPFSYDDHKGQNPPADSKTSFQDNYEALRLYAYGSCHSGGANFVYADGSAEFLNSDTSLAVLKALSTRAKAD